MSSGQMNESLGEEMVYEVEGLPWPMVLDFQFRVYPFAILQIFLS